MVLLNCTHSNCLPKIGYPLLCNAEKLHTATMIGIIQLPFWKRQSKTNSVYYTIESFKMNNIIERDGVASLNLLPSR